MSDKKIWLKLKSYGLTDAGAAGVMGNSYCESLNKSNNVEDRCTLSDDEYTRRVDNGTMSREQFKSDAYGYGLFQWTYFTRKAALYDFAKSKGVSISDEDMQVDFFMSEMVSQYESLLTFLKTTNDVYTAASRVCIEFERPAMNNVGARYSKAQEFYNTYRGTAAGAQTVFPSVTPTVKPVTQAETLAQYGEHDTANMPVLKRGDRGIAVGMVQFALQKHGYQIVADCDFGALTVNALSAFKLKHGISNLGNDYGKVTAEVWEALYA